MKRKFTLIELMAVIAILAILISMLFPSFQRARMMSQRVVEFSGAAQVMSLSVARAMNNRGKLPDMNTSGWGAEAYSVSGVWRGPGLLHREKYIDDKSWHLIANCIKLRAEYSKPDYSNRIKNGSYYPASTLWRKWNNNNSQITLSDDRQALMCETNWRKNPNLWVTEADKKNNPWWHNDNGDRGTFVAFKDGHVKFIADENYTLWKSAGYLPNSDYAAFDAWFKYVENNQP
ncbi:MAG: hypothetical protein RL095_2447 [Verrucomicrobiota bacterium]|jgi:prepilin-type N-terminal cleavage/methylation domain-containing protein